MLVVVAALVLVIVTIATTVVVARHLAGPGSDAGGGDGSTQQSTGVAARAADPSTAASDQGSVPNAAAGFECYDGRTTTSLAACGSSYDAAGSGDPLVGLNWVFPDRASRLVALGATCTGVGLGTRALHQQCTFEYQGAEVCVDWSQFDKFSKGRLDYRHLGTPVQAALGTGVNGLRWGPSPVTPGFCHGLAYKTAEMVKGGRWGMATYADDPSVATQAQADLGALRPVDNWNGVPVS